MSFHSRHKFGIFKHGRCEPAKMPARNKDDSPITDWCGNPWSWIICTSGDPGNQTLEIMKIMKLFGTVFICFSRCSMWQCGLDRGLALWVSWGFSHETIQKRLFLCRIPGFLRIVSLSTFWWCFKKMTYEVLKCEIVSKYIKYERKSNIAP